MLIFDAIMLAQAASTSPVSGGLIELPFHWVAATVGVVILLVLLYFARRLAGDEPDEEGR